jgi:uncharacterized protein YndB with AHSA1/START domain
MSGRSADFQAVACDSGPPGCGSVGWAATRIAIARRTYLVDQADLWDALTNADRIPRWFLPVSGDLRVGGRYQLKGNAGGVVEHCREPESFAVTWEFGGTLSWVEVTLTPDGERTTLELAHEAHVDPGLWGQSGPGAVGAGQAAERTAAFYTPSPGAAAGSQGQREPTPLAASGL